MESTSDVDSNPPDLPSKKRRMTFIERSDALRARTSVECSRGPSIHSKGRKGHAAPAKASPKPSTNTFPVLLGPAGSGLEGSHRGRGRSGMKLAFGVPSAEWEAYSGHVINGAARFLQLDSRTWLAEHFDLETEDRLADFPADIQRTFNKWTHVSVTRQADHRESFGCSNCPQFAQHTECVHTLLIQNRALEFMQWSSTSDPEVLVFHYEWQDHTSAGTSFTTQPTPSASQGFGTEQNLHPNTASSPSADQPATETYRTYRALFTVSDAVRHITRRSRHIVRFVGRSVQSPGAWACALCTDRSCPHIEASKRRLRALGLAPDCVDGEGLFVPKEYHPSSEFRQIQPELEKHAERSVSHRSRPEILFLLPPEERVLFDMNYNSIGPLGQQEDAVIADGQQATCRCGTATDSNDKFVTKPCTIYDIDRAYTSSIHLHWCPACKSFSAGPDLAELGLFNFDNKRIVTHRLIHKFDFYYSGQEGTFSAFANLVDYEYMSKNSDPPNFLPVDMFRTIWFSFVRLQQFADDGICPICQYQPFGLVVDGVTISTQCAKATGRIQPPTVSHTDSPVREHVRPATRGPGFQLVPQRQLRKRCLDIIDRVLKPDAGGQKKGRRKLVVRNTTDWALVDDSETDEDDGEVASGESINMVIARTGGGPLHAIVEEQATALVAHDPALQPLAAAFQFFVCKETPPDWRKIWLRFLRQVFCEESALQVVSFNCIVDLRLFAAWTATADDVKCMMLRGIVDSLRTQLPTFGVIASTCIDEHGIADASLLAVTQNFALWLAQRTQTVYNQLEKHRSQDGQPDPADIVQPDWRSTGQCYSRAQCRYRPRYPGIRGDGAYERNVVPSSENERDDVMCSKYYAMYGRRGYTGGLLGLWCTHGVSYGFHVIPQGEGRNDVFSAIYTRFEVAPKVIIYDFACALGPYCMLREAEYFRDTLFVIDRFHASGHKTCSAACMLSTYAEHDPRLAEFNSSVAEMGNSMLRYIRKSIRYMTESHAVLYVHRFLSIWNRRVKMKLAKSGKRSAPG